MAKTPRGTRTLHQRGKKQPTSKLPPTPQACPVTILGRDGSKHMFITPEGMRLELTTAKLSQPAELLGLFTTRVEWLELNFPKASNRNPYTFDGAAAAKWLIEQSSRSNGSVLRSTLRSTGVWPSANSAGLDINLGDKVIIDGVEHAVAEAAPSTGYIGSQAILRWHDRPASHADALRISDAIQSFRFQTRGQRDLLLGWIGIAFFAGAMRWRPHVYLVAPRGSGKSELIATLSDILGDVSAEAGKDSSAAYLRQEFDGRSLAILVDEAEDNELQHVSGLILLARHMSDKSGAVIGRGTSGGDSRQFTITGTMFMAAIARPQLTPQDRSRFAQINLLSPYGKAYSAEQQTILADLRQTLKENAPAMLRRMIERWSIFLETELDYRKRLLEVGGIQNRFADQAACLLAGFDVLLLDARRSANDISARINEMLPCLFAAMAVEEEETGELVLHHLCTTLAATLDRALSGTIGDLIQDADEAGGDAKATKTIRAFGLSIVTREGIKFLAVANSNASLLTVFRGTPWANGRWPGALSQLESAVKGKDPIHFSPRSVRAVLVPMSSVMNGRER